MSIARAAPGNTSNSSLLITDVEVQAPACSEGCHQGLPPGRGCLGPSGPPALPRDPGGKPGAHPAQRLRPGRRRRPGGGAAPLSSPPGSGRGTAVRGGAGWSRNQASRQTLNAQSDEPSLPRRPGGSSSPATVARRARAGAGARQRADRRGAVRSGCPASPSGVAVDQGETGQPALDIGGERIRWLTGVHRHQDAPVLAGLVVADERPGRLGEHRELVPGDVGRVVGAAVLGAAGQQAAASAPARARPGRPRRPT
jgi:hypothetical protein